MGACVVHRSSGAEGTNLAIIGAAAIVTVSSTTMGHASAFVRQLCEALSRTLAQSLEDKIAQFNQTSPAEFWEERLQEYLSMACRLENLWEQAKWAYLAFYAERIALWM